MELGGNLPESMSQYLMLGHNADEEVEKEEEDPKVGNVTPTS
jgi:hypothetical protein